MVAIWSTRSGNSQFHCPDLHHNTISHWQADCFTLLLVYRPGQQLCTYVCLGWVTLQVGARKQNKKMRKCFFSGLKGKTKHTILLHGHFSKYFVCSFCYSFCVMKSRTIPALFLPSKKGHARALHCKLFAPHFQQNLCTAPTLFQISMQILELVFWGFFTLLLNLLTLV